MESMKVLKTRNAERKVLNTESLLYIFSGKDKECEARRRLEITEVEWKQRDH